MQGLTYEQRKRIVFNFLYASDGGLLRRYRLPEHLSDDAMRDEVNLLVEDINGLIPSVFTDADFRLLMPEINAAIRRRHGAQGWPPAKVFIAATEDAVAVVAKKVAIAGAEQRSARNEFEIAANRMAAGQAVAEGYLWGRSAVEMIAAKLVDRETMVAYRTGAYTAHREQYGEAVADRWRAEREARHDAAREVYLARKRGEQILTGAEMDRLRSELAAFDATMESRASEMRQAAWAS